MNKTPDAASGVLFIVEEVDRFTGYAPGAIMRSSSEIFRARILRYIVVRPMPRISAARDLFPSASARAATMVSRSDCS